MPFELFIIPGLVCFAIAFFKEIKNKQMELLGSYWSVLVNEILIYK